MARHNLGYLEFLAGNLPLALQLMDEAAAIPTVASLAIAALDKARVLLEAGLSDAADATLLRAEQGVPPGPVIPRTGRDSWLAPNAPFSPATSRRRGARGIGTDPIRPPR